MSDYWENVYSSCGGDFSGGWPDQYARQLELTFMDKVLTSRRYSTLDLGCGPLALAESPNVARRLIYRPYVGIDSSPTACNAARARAQFIGMEDYEIICEKVHTPLPGAHTVLSRRLLINLPRPLRKELLESFTAFPAGIIIEPTKRSFARLNQMRAVNGLEPLEEPSFNDYLTVEEEELILRLGASAWPVMGNYFMKTRGVEPRGVVKRADRLAAYLSQPWPGGPEVGPIAFVWGEP